MQEVLGSFKHEYDWDPETDGAADFMMSEQEVQKLQTDFQI